MKREVKTTEDGMLVAELRPAADFAEGSFQSMAWPEGDGVTAVTGVLTEDETIAVQGLEFDAEAFDAETAQAWLDENEGALLEWRGERADEEEEDEEEDEDEESEEEKDAGKGLSRDQVRAVAEKVREAALTLTETADELETLVEGDDESLEGDRALTITTSGDGVIDALSRKIEALERTVQGLSRAKGSDDDPAERSDGSSDVEDSYGILDAASNYAGS